MRSVQEPSLPEGAAEPTGAGRLSRAFAAASWPRKAGMLALAVLAVLVAGIVLHAALLLVLSVGLPLLLIGAVFVVWKGMRSVLATAVVAALGMGAVLAGARGAAEPWYALLMLLPPVAAVLASVGLIGRRFAACRTTAWTLGWSLPFGLAAAHYLHRQPFLGPAFAWLIALIVLGWRLANALQDSRARSPQFSSGGALAAPHAWAPAGAPVPGGSKPRPGGQPGGAPVRAAQAGDGLRSGQPQQRAPAPQPAADWQHISVDEAVAELDAMVGLTAVKEQVRSITASVEAARRRAMAGHGTEKPMQHFVFLGPSGTGKTAVARTIAKIFYAFGLLDSPVVVEAQRADLVGEYLGATAIKTNELVDSALGRLLFIDEAYSLVNEGDGQGDRFGNEAVQALLKRAEDDRENLIIVLAGYERQMENFLASNPGLNSRFGIRVKFPGYSPAELLALADLVLQGKGELLDPDARPVLRRVFEEIGRRRLADELGNGRFVRSLLAKAGQQRDVRVMAAAAEPSAADLVTLRGGDIELAYGELTARFRGYSDTPTVESALAELDALVGLEPVKRQVHEIAAQLRVARLRDRQGLASQPPVRHFVFTGPPGTGKTTVARIIGRIFAALGLLVRPEVVEAHRADLVGEHLGSTAIKTNKLVDSALGGVLFIDEAYALHNEAYSGGDAFGSEAVATLLKRAEDDRERLVIVLAGYPQDMDRLLRSNPGLASRFSTRITFPSYSAEQLTRIAESIAGEAGDTFDPDAVPVLASIFSQASEQGHVDELGNGRFARSLFERAAATRDLRISHQGEAATAADLTTVLAADVLTAYRQLTG
jgi:SpoVK/Ycf46/Vps4 family AAA+-type ATPase